MTTAALSKVVTAPNAAFSSDEIRAAGGPWKNFVLRVTAQNDTGSSAALEVKLADVITDIRLTNQGTLATSDSADFVTQVTGAEKPSNYAGTSITFLDYTNSFGITGNGFTKSANAGWGANLWTREYTVNSGFVSGEFIDHNTFMGLSNDGQAIDHFKSLEFALFADGGDRQVKVYESGTAVYNTGRSLTGVWAIAYDGVAVRYFCDGTLVYTSTKTIVAGWTMYAGFNAYDIGGSVKNVQFGIMGDQALAQLAINTIVNIASDNLITAGSEKRNLLDTYNRLSAETQRLIQESNSFTALYGDLTPTERTAAAAALKALKDYLDSLTPAWTTITANSVVDGPTLSARFKDLIDANLSLQSANNIVLRKHADWDGVTGDGKDELIKQASDAFANAKEALSALDIIQSDDYLSIDEKPTIVRLFNDIKNEQAGLVAQAQSIGVSSAAGGPIATYIDAYRNLYDYLTGLTPAYNHPTLPTAIVGATFSGKFSDYYFARTALINATAAKAATIAAWAGVTGSGKPADNADVTGDNTAKDTNAVGGRPATDLITQIDKTTTLTDLTPPSSPTGLALTSTVKANPDGAQVVTLVATWNPIPTPKNPLSKYVLAIKEGADGGFVEFEVGSASTRYERVVPANVLYVAKVKAVDRNNNPSAFSSEVGYTTVKDAVPPAPVTEITVDTAFQSAFVTWNNPSDSDLASAEVKLHSADGVPVQTLSVSARPSTRGTVTISKLLKASSYFVIITALDGSGNRAPAIQSGTFTTAGGIAVGDLTPGLDLITTVTTLPDPAGYTGPKTVFLQNEGLYVYKGGKWVSSSSGEIEDGSIGGAKLVDGAITAAKLNAALGGGNLIRNFGFEQSYQVAGYDLAKGFAIYNNATDESPSWTVNSPGRRNGFAQGVGWVRNTGVKGFYLTDVAGVNNLGLMQPNSTYTLTFYAYGLDAAAGSTVGLRWNIAPNVTAILQPKLTSEWQRYQFKLVTGATADPQIFITTDYIGPNGGRLYIDDIQLQEGDVATSYAPAFLDGEVTSSKLAVGSVTTAKLDALAVTADKVAANAITANKLVVSSRPISVVGINIRADNDGVVRWNSGKITYPDDDGNYVTRDIVAGGAGWNPGWGQPVNFCFRTDSTGPQTLGVFYTPDVTSGVYGRQIPLATWNNGNDFQVKAGTSTIITGGQIMTGSVHADRLIARTITADHMVLGTLTAAQIATGALTARVLAIGNSDNIITDGGFHDDRWWIGGGPADPRVRTDYIGFVRMDRGLVITPAGGIDVSSQSFTVEPGATYKVVCGFDLSADFSGEFRPILHLPGVAWYSLKNGSGIDPSDRHPAFNYTVAGTSLYVEWYITADPSGAHRNWNFRFMGGWSGTVKFSSTIVRVSDTTLIANGAITTDKITVNSLDGDRIKVNTLDASKIRADSVIAGSVTVGGSGTLARAFQTASWSAVADDNGYRPQNGATVGAPNGTYVGSALAQDLVTDLYNILADNVLSRGEKPEVLSRIQKIEQNWAYIRNTAAGLGISYATLDTRYYSLRNYLDNDVGRWSDVTVDTSINGAHLRNLFIDYNSAESDLVRSINQTAAQRADWAGVSGANRPQDNATKGAPDGTYVGSTLAETLVGSVNNIVDDNVISRGEKTALITTYNSLATAGAAAHAASGAFISSGFGDPTYGERVNYDSARANLEGYLGTIPTWNDPNSDTAVNGAHLRNLFYLAWVAINDLIKANNSQAAIRSQWGGVTGPNRPADNATVGAPGGTYVGNTEAQQVTNWAYTGALDPVGRINANVTQIDPGRILISGNTSLSDWRFGGDLTQIRGGAIAANTITANKLTIGNRGVSVIGCEFFYQNGRLYWNDGHILYTDDAGNPSSPYIPAGSVVWNGGSYNYIVWDKGAGGFRQTAPDDWGATKQAVSDTIIMCTWRNGTSFVANYGGTIITGDRIVTGTITADRLNVGSLSAITANIGLLRTATSGARTEIEANLIRVYDANNVLRVRLGVW